MDIPEFILAEAGRPGCNAIGIGDIPAICASRPIGSLLEERYAFRCTVNNGLKPEQFSTPTVKSAWGPAISP
jgi:hypothetical protein